MSSISRDVRNLARAPRISATVIDVVGKRCSVRISNSARTLKNIPFYGSVPSIGDIVDVDYSSGKPSAYVTQRVTSLAVDTDLRTTREAPPEEDVYPEVEEEVVAVTEKTYTWLIENVDSYESFPGARIPSNCTITRVDALITDGTTAEVNINIRPDADWVDNNILATDLEATTAGASAITNTSVVAGNWLWLEVGYVVGYIWQLVVTVTVSPAA